MKTLKELQGRELDAWIAKLFGWPAIGGVPLLSASTSPQGAMAVLEKCTEKCTLHSVAVAKLAVSENWVVYEFNDFAGRGEAPTLPLAIARFARKLFEV